MNLQQSSKNFALKRLRIRQQQWEQFCPPLRWTAAWIFLPPLWSLRPQKIPAHFPWSRWASQYRAISDSAGVAASCCTRRGYNQCVFCECAITVQYHQRLDGSSTYWRLARLQCWPAEVSHYLYIYNILDLCLPPKPVAVFLMINPTWVVIPHPILLDPPW